MLVDVDFWSFHLLYILDYSVKFPFDRISIFYYFGVF